MTEFSEDQIAILKRLYVAGKLSTSGNFSLKNLLFLESFGLVKSECLTRGATDFIQWSLTESGKKLVVSWNL